MDAVAAAPPRMNVSREGDRVRLVLAGDLDLRTTPDLFRQLETVVPHGRTGHLPAAPAAVDVDLGGVGRCDTSGAALIVFAGLRLAGPKGTVHRHGAGERVAALLAMVDREEEAPEVVAHRSLQSGIIETAGEFAIEVGSRLRETLDYVGAVVLGIARVIRSPGSLRWGDAVHYMALSGADALGIVALINFLMGVILAFQAVAQLAKFGVEMYTPDTVGISVCMELGALMTAIIVAGRSGSGFAAEIGTMTVNEEVAALDSMGLDRTRFLVMPKVIALVAMMPLLVVFADACGVVGGLSIGILSLEMPIGIYLRRTADAVTAWHLTQGIIKGVCYAVVVAAVGCLRGLQTRRGAQGVGIATTSAVVSGIFLIVCVDAVLTVIFHHVE